MYSEDHRVFALRKVKEDFEHEIVFIARNKPDPITPEFNSSAIGLKSWGQNPDSSRNLPKNLTAESGIKLWNDLKNEGYKAVLRLSYFKSTNELMKEALACEEDENNPELIDFERYAINHYFFDRDEIDDYIYNRLNEMKFS